MMIVFNGVKFAKNDKEMTDSLFSNGGTCAGYYKVTKRGIQILDLQRNIIAFIVNNGYGERFIVSAIRCDNGRIRYMFSTCSKVDRLLFLEELGYKGTIEECERVLKEVSYA